MPRPPRFQYPGAIYHVINRGNYRSWVFEDEGAKGAFQKALQEACERAGWTLHAYCVMGNHYHLAIETPEPNLSDGMRWLQSVYANRFNQYRTEHGHLFQGRFKSILVEDYERLAWLCHYIHLNPVRAGICDLVALKNYPYSSYWNLRKTKSRSRSMSFNAFLEGAGGLKDTPAGRSRYETYLKWLNQDRGAKKNALFDKMSIGWALGTKEFKQAVVKDLKRHTANVELGGKDYNDIKEAQWHDELARCMKLLRITKPAIPKAKKSSHWKVAIATHLKTTMLCKNPWLSENLHMGAHSGISRYCSELQTGQREQAAKLLKRLS